MKNFRQSYRTIIAFFFLGIFLNVFITDITCSVDKLGDSDNHKHDHQHSHHHSHTKDERVIENRNITIFSDNSCCSEETSSFYSSVNKVVVSKSLSIYFPVDLIAIPIDYDFLSAIFKHTWTPLHFNCNKAPPKIEKRLFILHETLLI